MAMGLEREREQSLSSSSSSKPLHNFNLPFGLRWGNQKFLRCMKVNSNGEISAVQRRPSSSSSLAAAFNASNGNRNGNLNSSSSADVLSIIGKRKEREKCDDPSINRDRSGDGIAAVREKLMFDLQTAADKMKDAILRERLEPDEQHDNLPSLVQAPATLVATVATTASEIAEAAARPWNLRTRRAACKAPSGNGCSSAGAGTSNGGSGDDFSPEKSLKVDLAKPNFGASPSRVAVVENNKSSPRPRSGGATTATASPSNEKKERAKFSVSITRQEIEEDFLAIAGRRPPRRPQKRSKYIQKNLDTLFPGLWLIEITAEMYKVPETQ
ncbi:unnamed protein product [Coffea canephora]|uniref:DUF1639 family protein n=1 Tax=Coffea canephora TaxID=49390 RepID=A0A068TXK7_COFCA|nr:unnamed protein product [Coffea canephora]